MLSRATSPVISTTFPAQDTSCGSHFASEAGRQHLPGQPARLLSVGADVDPGSGFRIGIALRDELAADSVRGPDGGVDGGGGCGWAFALPLGGTGIGGAAAVGRLWDGELTEL